MATPPALLPDLHSPLHLSSARESRITTRPRPTVTSPSCCRARTVRATDSREVPAAPAVSGCSRTQTTSGHGDGSCIDIDVALGTGAGRTRHGLAMAHREVREHPGDACSGRIGAVLAALPVGLTQPPGDAAQHRESQRPLLCQQLPEPLGRHDHSPSVPERGGGGRPPSAVDAGQFSQQFAGTADGEHAGVAVRSLRRDLHEAVLDQDDVVGGDPRASAAPRAPSHAGAPHRRCAATPPP